MESTPYSKLYSDVSSPLTMQHSSPSGGGSSVGNGGFGCIEHTVTKFDTLAGVAIRYGVEVADIKRMNGLTTDLQMFACKSLQIPLPGRHPPSSIVSNGYSTLGQTSSEMTPPNRRYSDSLDSIRSLKLSSSPQRNISPSIKSLMDGVDEGFEMTQTSNIPLGFHRKPKSEANGFSKICSVPVANEKIPDSDKSIEKLVRRRKSDVDINNHTPEMLIKPDNSSSSVLGLALRPKTANRTTTESESGSSSVFSVGSRDSSTAQILCGVRKSSSAPTFQHSESNNSNNKNSDSASSLSSWRTSMLNFALDFQALSTAAITSPLFDGLPKPTSGRKNKPARD